MGAEVQQPVLGFHRVERPSKQALKRPPDGRIAVQGRVGIGAAAEQRVVNCPGANAFVLQ